MTLIKKKFRYKKGLVKQKGLIPPFVPPNVPDIKFYWKGEFDGLDLINIFDANAIHVSGSGLDAIYDFSGLGDERLNKNSYIGNSFALPENYNFPYPIEIYFDTLNPYHWKLPDFHYFFIQKQMDIDPQLINNIFFLKAKATTNTSNILTETNELIIYNTEQTGNDVTILEKWMGIQLEFYGDNTVINGDFIFNVNNWSASRCTINWQVEQFARCIQNNGSAGSIVIIQANAHNISFPVKITFFAKSSDVTTLPSILSAHYNNIEIILQPNLNYEWQKCEFKAVPKSTSLVIYPSSQNIEDGDIVDIDSIISQNLYKNYYKA